MSSNSEGSQQMTKKTPEAQGIDKTTEIQAKDGPRTTIVEEEEDEFWKEVTDETKGHVDEFEDSISALRIWHSETFREMTKRLRTRGHGGE
jgi:hypothetical protein